MREAAALLPENLQGIDLLNEVALRQLAEERRWDEIIGRIDFVVRSAANAGSGGPDLIELDRLHHRALHKARFCEAFIDLLYGRGDSPQRLQRYVDLATTRGFPSGWELPTFWLMLIDPSSDCFIKPDAFSWLLALLGKPFSIGKPNGKTYTRLIKLAREIAIQLGDGPHIDMPILYHAIWSCYAAEVPAVRLAPKPAAPRPEIESKVSVENFRIINIDKETEAQHRASIRRHKDAALNEQAFDLFETMAVAPLSQKADKAHRDAMLERPALTLVREILAFLPERVKSQFFSVPLTAYGTERGRVSLTVTFYRKGGKWRGEPQLFFVFSEDGVECGYSIEWFMGLYLERFRSNFVKNEALMSAWLEEVATEQFGLKNARIKEENGAASFKAESFIGDNREIRISFSCTRERVLTSSRTRLASSISGAAARLFPVLQLALDEEPFADAILDDITPTISAVIAEPEAPPPSPEPMPEAVAETVPVVEETESSEELATVAHVVEETAAGAADAIPVSTEALTEPVAPPIESQPESTLVEATTTNEEKSSIEEPTVVDKMDDAAGSESAPTNQPDETPSVEPETGEQEKPRGLLDVLAREVEEHTWSQNVAIPASKSDEKDPAISTLQEFEVLGFTHRRNAGYSLAQCAEETGFSESQLREWLSAIDRKGQAVFYGPPGTGKTFMAERFARHLIGNGDGFTRLIQMHAAVTYDDFIESRRVPTTPGADPRPYGIPGRFVEFCREAEGRTGTCVLILDELHRVNLDLVAGELLYLLEHRDRDIQLAGGTRFRVPANVRVIGTMSTADRSAVALDSTIRRRFAFLELGPRYEVLRHFHRISDRMPVEELIGVLESVNRRIGNKRHEIGITYFLRHDAPSMLANIWRTEIEPLIEECFADRPETAAAFRWDAVRRQLNR